MDLLGQGTDFSRNKGTFVIRCPVSWFTSLPLATLTEVP